MALYCVVAQRHDSGRQLGRVTQPGAKNRLVTRLGAGHGGWQFVGSGHIFLAHAASPHHPLARSKYPAAGLGTHADSGQRTSLFADGVNRHPRQYFFSMGWCRLVGGLRPGRAASATRAIVLGRQYPHEYGVPPDRLQRAVLWHEQPSQCRLSHRFAHRRPGAGFKRFLWSVGGDVYPHCPVCHWRTNGTLDTGVPGRHTHPKRGVGAFLVESVWRWRVAQRLICAFARTCFASFARTNPGPGTHLQRTHTRCHPGSPAHPNSHNTRRTTRRISGATLSARPHHRHAHHPSHPACRAFCRYVAANPNSSLAHLVGPDHYLPTHCH